MTNYTDGQIEELLAKLRSMAVEVHQHIGADSEHQRVSRLLVSASLALSDLAERQAAKAGVVTDEVVNRALRASMDVQDGAVATCIGRKAMRAALASVWPTAGGGVRDTKVASLVKAATSALDVFSQYRFTNTYAKLESALDAIAAAEGEK